MNALEFKPEIWTTNDRLFLVCGNRWMRGNEARGAIRTDDQRSFDFVAHAIAIELTGGKRSIGHIHDSNSDWRIKSVESCGLSNRSAQAALSEAWRIVDVKLDVSTMTGAVFFDHKKANYKDQSAIWKMIAMIEWQRWTKSNIAMLDRVKILHSLGFEKVTEKSLTRTAEKHGL